MDQITIQEFIQDWRDGLIIEPLIFKDRVYGKTVKGQAHNPEGYKIVYADIPEVMATSAAVPTEKKSLATRIREALRL